MIRPEGVSAHVMRGARHLISIEAVSRDPEIDGIWWIAPRLETQPRRRVQRIDDYHGPNGEPLMMCSCPYGARNGLSGHCKHRVAVLLLESERER